MAIPIPIHVAEGTTAPDPEEVFISTLTTKTPTPRPVDPAASIKSLFDAVPDTTNTPNTTIEISHLQSATKALVLCCLPLTLAWTAISTLLMLEYLAFKTRNPISDDKKMEQVRTCVREDVEVYRRRLARVDARMPELVSRCQTQYHNSVAFFKTASTAVHTQADATDLTGILASLSKFASVKSYVGLLVLVAWTMPSPPWMWIVFAAILASMSRFAAVKSSVGLLVLMALLMPSPPWMWIAFGWLIKREATRMVRKQEPVR
ncbi:hypothetical protein LTR09_007121 [Extremus antarcticus]|uniref:Uncharacterized protein n=1 Tax=Extremus antarcticus TaxID=702011 RepID=A0AAJ0DKU9_9PEZI|nr:hypothetical protein LTR09_007121 [Extremus antarcticus]